MALETLKGIKDIGGFKITDVRAIVKSNTTRVEFEDWDETDYIEDIVNRRRVKKKCSRCPILIDHNNNSITFKIQDGPIKENGVNGCQIDTIIETARIMLSKLNENFSCNENIIAISYLDDALFKLSERKKDRLKRGVEGKSED